MNYFKSLLMGCNVHIDRLRSLAAILDVSVGTLPITYLGAALGGNPKRRSFWNPVLEQMRGKLGLWSSKWLSLSGRLVMLKSVMSAVPIYHMAIFLAPVGIIGEMEKLMRGFLWRRREGGRRISWIAWSQICKRIQLGGFGLGFLSWKNKAMLIKWFWRFGMERNALWRRILCAKYNCNPQLMLLHEIQVPSSNLSIYIQDIFKILREDTIIAKVYKEGCVCSVGYGENIRFWIDPWIDGSSLFRRFPRLFAITQNKNAFLCDVGLMRMVAGPGISTCVVAYSIGKLTSIDNW